MARTTVYNKITSEELWKKVNVENKTLLKDFSAYLNSTDKSDGTIKGYNSDLKILFTWIYLERENKEFVNLTKRDIVACQNYLITDFGWGSNRVRRFKSAMSSLSDYIETVLDEEYPDFRNIINKIPAPPKNTAREKTVLKDEQIDELLKHLVDKGQYQRACAVALAVSSGARRSEILRFKHYFFKDEYIVYDLFYKTPETVQIKGRGKKGKNEKRYILVNSFKPYFDLWMEEREKLGIDSEYLFVGKRDDEWKQLKFTTLDSWRNIFSRFLGVDWYWHANRHYFVTSMKRAGVSSELIKMIISWNSIDMVEIYDDTEADEKFENELTQDVIEKIK